jgi:hypothetical protein
VNSIVTVAVAVLLGLWVVSRQRWPAWTVLPAIAGAVFLLVTAVAALLKPRASEVLQTHLDIYEEVGVRLGQQVAEALPLGGDVLVFTYPYEPGVMEEFPASQVKGLQDTLRATSCRILATVPSKAGPQSEFIELAIEDQVLREALAAHPGADAVVSFSGLPVSDLAAFEPRPPPLFAFGGVDLHACAEHIRHGLLRAAVFPAVGRTKAEVGTGSPPRDIFDTAFVIVTRDNLEHQLSLRKPYPADEKERNES